MCGIVIETQENQIQSIRGDADDPFSKGHICPKAVALQDIQSDPDRLRKPLRRTSSGFSEISWDEAFDETAAKLASIQAQHGRNAAAVYLGNPTVHNYGSMLFAPMFLQALRTKNRFSATSVDQLPHQLAAFWMFGHQLLIPVPDIDRTSFMLIMGGNPAASNGSLMTAPGVTRRLKAIRERGGKVVLIDPRRTETAAYADTHHFIRPGTDAVLLMALLNVIFAEKLDSPGKLSAFTDGLDTVRSLVQDVTPERAAAITGIAAGSIGELARAFAAAPAAVCYGRMGLSTQSFGALCQWLVNVLNLVTGNLDRPGGAMFTLPAVDGVGATRKARGGLRGGYGRWKSRVRGLPEGGGELPVAVLAEEILTEGDGRIHALVTSAGNPVLSTPNGAQLDRALAKLDFMVSIDFYLNETTRHAHIILPPTPPLEHDHYDLAFHFLAVRNTAKYSPPLFPPPKGALHDWEIFLALLRRMEKGAAAKAKHTLLQRLGPRGILKLGLRFGPHGAKLNPLSKGLSLRKLERHPHGIDLGALTPLLPERLATQNGRIEAAPDRLVADVERLRRELLTPISAASSEFDLLLIGRRHIRSNNSWMHNSPRLVKGPNRCTLLMHPADAEARGLANGAKALLSSRAGVVEADVEITSDMMPGVVSLPHGWGHGREGVRLAVAREHAGVSLNDVTDDQGLDALAGTAVLNGVPVRVTGLPAPSA
jgi:anaerobic selenocysteine-containing dehydrogenase